ISQYIDALSECEVIFSSWGMPLLDRSLLEKLPHLSFVFYAAGSTRYFTTDAMWDRGVRVCSAWRANAIPVADYTVGAVLMSLKRVWHYASEMKRAGKYTEPHDIPGTYGTTVGIVSLGVIGRMVCERLARYDMKVLVYDPFVADDDVRSLEVERASLEDLFTQSDVISIHTPLLDETVHMIGGELLSRMKSHATFINTSRGAVVDERALIEVLFRRPDLYALLDVTEEEPLPSSSPLYSLPNAILTPHIAGSLGPERLRLGKFMADEFIRWHEGKPLLHEVTRDMASRMV
ncbi:MAG TPA: hydroxyacid dehydrogenase, partial [Spirochaetota bacterium]